MQSPDNGGTHEQSAATWSRVFEFLKSASAYPAGLAPEVIETHISVIFLVGEHAYKLKRPVRYAFIDYGTYAARHHACIQEMELNRRLAPDVYLATLPVTQEADGSLALEGHGQPVEWVVKMRRLPSDRMLDRLISRATVDPDMITRLATVLVEFYRRSPPIELPAGRLSQSITAHIWENFRELSKPVHGLDDALVQRVHGRQLQFAQLEDTLIEARSAAHRVIAGHGDLRPEHICMEERPVIFDCIDFNDELRRLDAVDELCFLAMECERIGGAWIGDAVLAAYAHAACDHMPSRLIEFYKAYRASVRAKVAVLRAVQLPVEQQPPVRQLAWDYLRLADRTFGRASGPLCLMVRGRVGTGKSTVAAAIAEALGMKVLQTDQLRQRVVGEPGPPDRYGEGRFATESRLAVYDAMFRAAESHLANGISVVVDACFLSLELQRRAAAMAQVRGAPFLIVSCSCPAAVAVARIEARARLSDCRSEARVEHVAAQAAEDEGRLADVPGIDFDTSEGSQESRTRSITAALKELLGLAHYASVAEPLYGANADMYRSLQAPIVRYTAVNPVSVSTSTPVPKVAELMRASNLQHVPVLDKDAVVGVISQRDIRLVSGATGFYTLSASDIMARAPGTVDGDTSLARVVRTMVRNSAASALVTDHGHVVGVFTAVDALRALSEVIDTIDPLEEGAISAASPEARL